jgi:glutamyl-tRNA reductase
MQLVLIGLNHKTAPIEIREKFYLNPIQQDLFLSELKAMPNVAEAFMLSTCNRTEVYAHVIDEYFRPEIFIRMIMNIKKIQFSEDFKDYFYRYTGQSVIEHFFKVCAGLDSLVLGEKQILGQVKTSIERARNLGMFSKYFNILTNLGIRVGKKAQNETKICFGGSSIGWAAIEQAEKSLGTLKEKTILMIGAGKMGEVAVGQLQNKGLKKLYVMNRTHETAEDLAKRFGAEAIGFMEIKDALCEVDICLCSVSAPHYILDQGTLRKVMQFRKDRPLLLIDISMPRNIDPHSSEITGITLYHIDDLTQVVDASMKIREEAMISVKEIIAQKLLEFDQKLSRVTPDHSDVEQLTDV